MRNLGGYPESRIHRFFVVAARAIERYVARMPDRTARADRLTARRLWRLDRALAARILAFAVEELAPFRPELVLDVDESDDAGRSFAAYEYDGGAGRAADRFLHERGEELTTEERAWIFAQRRTRPGVWQVHAPAALIAGAFDMSDVFQAAAESPSLVFAPAPKGLAAGDAILARVVEHEGVAVATAAHPMTLRARHVDLYVDLVRRALGRTRPPHGDELRERGMARLLVDSWGRLGDLLAERVARAAACERRRRAPSLRAAVSTAT